MAAISASHLRVLISAIPEDRRTGVIAVRAPETDQLPAELVVGAQQFAVARCDSTLAIRERLCQQDGSSSPLILLTGLAETELADDIRARLFKRTLLTVEPWAIVRDLFRAQAIDPRLAQEAWLADLLVRNVPPAGYPPANNGVLDRETAWRRAFSLELGLDNGRPDALGWLRWTLEAGSAERYAKTSSEFRAGLRRWVEETAGALGIAILDCLDAGFGEDAVPIGVVCGVVFHPQAEGEFALAQAAVRLERHLGDRPLAATDGKRWAELAERIVRQRLASAGLAAVREFVARADSILEDVRAAAYAHLSCVSLAGFGARSRQVASGISEAIEQGGPPSGELVRRVARVRDHALAASQKERVERMEMAVRLARWLQCGAHSAPSGSLTEAARHYAADGAFVDWARQTLTGGDPEAELSQAYGALLREAESARERQNRHFAELLAVFSEAGGASADILLIEQVLEEVVAPFASEVPVLLIVLDGMSAGVCSELTEDLVSGGWVRLCDAARGADEVAAPACAIAALPTVTEVCRASLLCGTLASGGSHEEKRGFAEHPALRGASKPRFPPLLFHKPDLLDPGGTQLAQRVREAIGSSERQIVGVVLNAVDDYLFRSEQRQVQWSVASIRFLDALLYEAQLAGRAVVLTSDHGHVLEAHTQQRSAEPGDRWRTAVGEPGKGEVLLSGARVVSAHGERIVAAWSERVRYGAKKAGYHGGASPQEVVVPVVILAPAEAEVRGWREAGMSYPPWWREVEPSVPVVEPPVRRVRKAHEQEDLFSAARRRPSWIDALLRSPVFKAQQDAAGRQAPPEERARQFLLALDERRGVLTRSALAQRLNVPPVRLPGLIASMRRLLNVDGYDVLAVEEGDTVRLDRDLLRVQFELQE